jgi:anti-sigma factor RsiW
MEITRDNYEEYFVLYIDKELNATDRAEVERFVRENPDLKTELEMFGDTVLSSGDVVPFEDKSSLYRQTSSTPQSNFVTSENCEEYFVLYADNELSDEESGAVEAFVYNNPAQQENFELIQEIRFQPESHIVFPDKSLLYRTAGDHKVVPMFTRMRFWKMAAAAAVLVFICGTAWFALNDHSGNTDVSSPVAANNNSSTVAPRVVKQPKADAATPADQPSADNIEPRQALAIAPPKITASTPKRKVIPGKVTINPDVAEATGLTEKLPADNTVKKSLATSNIPAPSSVKHISGGAEKVVEVKTQDIGQATATDPSLALAQNEKKVQPEQVAIGPVELKEGSAFASLANDNDELFESPDKNKKMRGFFRKVTRVFDKATSKEPSENRKGLRIASFAIAL